MKDKEPFPDLTKTEFDLLRILWKSGKLSVREVHNQIVENYSWAYSTTKTMMERMVKKGLLDRKQFHGIYLYSPLISRPKGFVRLIQFISDRVLELDHCALVSLFSRSKALTPEEIEELSQILNEEKDKAK